VSTSDNIVPLRPRLTMRDPEPRVPDPVVRGPVVSDPVLVTPPPTQSASLGARVREAMEWLRDHPNAATGGSDYLDAAYTIAARHGGEISHGDGWHEFLANVQAAAEGRMPVPDAQQEAEP
jgi:hypothetical protein